jgi:hypothetical protein
MISARLMVKLALICLAIAVIAFLLVAYGLTSFKFVGFLAILGGVANIAVSLVALATGMLKNDMRN